MREATYLANQTVQQIINPLFV